MGTSTKGLIMDIYRILIDPTPDVPIKHAYMTKWETYVGTQLPPETWQLVWRRAAKTSLCTTFK